MFENLLPDRTVVEVEVEGEQQLCIGIHQAIKYRSPAAADAGFPLLTSRVRSVVVAYSVGYPKARELADRYEIPLLAADAKPCSREHTEPSTRCQASSASASWSLSS